MKCQQDVATGNSNIANYKLISDKPNSQTAIITSGKNTKLIK